MDKYDALKKVFDYQSSLERFMNDEDLLRKVLAAYIKENIVDEARGYLTNKDFEKFTSSIHTLKGTSGNVGIENVYKLASELLALLRSEKYRVSEVEEKFNKLELLQNEVCSGIETFLRTN